MERTLNFKERRYIEELRILTKSTAIDCIIDDRFDRLVYIITPGDMGIAIGKSGDNIRKMQKVLGKRIEMVEYAEDPAEFVRNIFKPAEVIAVRFEEERGGAVQVTVQNRSEVGIAIGKGGCTIEKARMILRRFFGEELGDIIVEEEYAA
ncbi:MAG: NusA-like transcription termination signal-binding factor [Methanocalculus sp. MSAO_Arc1]|uniref:NusA-like transcription termination signal-binding factor n=1 Tax=Methanocalculus TaxID=71151 RepID=UPI000FF716CB|nr:MULTISPECIES: NusA-like transcription termination signal-binding factor [unclassified Methanocalculus]MCP1662302.1 N utilization substance protein A [Methanocalculus sp. AMF5]RQD80936.1 MAG: NusA-like transcription termination signal-binding factor [Methanocalculus sp. MSAO_Arc1]